jgi:large subunit ribosomal protein L10
MARSEGPEDRRRRVNRAEKQELVAELNEVFRGTSVVVVTHYTGLNVAAMTELRRKMKDAGAGFKVTKNRLARLALDGTDYGSLADMLTGPTAIAFSDDPVAAPKTVVDFAKTHENLVILGGAMGTSELDADGVKALASLPSLDELRGKLVGLLQAPATKVAGVLQAPAGQLARVLQARADQGAGA